MASWSGRENCGGIRSGFGWQGLPDRAEKGGRTRFWLEKEKKGRRKKESETGREKEEGTELKRGWLEREKRKDE